MIGEFTDSRTQVFSLSLFCFHRPADWLPSQSQSDYPDSHCVKWKKRGRLLQVVFVSFPVKKPSPEVT